MNANVKERVVEKGKMKEEEDEEFIKYWSSLIGATWGTRVKKKNCTRKPVFFELVKDAHMRNSGGSDANPIGVLMRKLSLALIARRRR